MLHTMKSCGFGSAAALSCMVLALAGCADMPTVEDDGGADLATPTVLTLKYAPGDAERYSLRGVSKMSLSGSISGSIEKDISMVMDGDVQNAKAVENKTGSEKENSPNKLPVRMKIVSIAGFMSQDIGGQRQRQDFNWQRGQSGKLGDDLAAAFESLGDSDGTMEINQSGKFEFQGESGWSADGLLTEKPVKRGDTWHMTWHGNDLFSTPDPDHPRPPADMTLRLAGATNYHDARVWIITAYSKSSWNETVDGVNQNGRVTMSGKIYYDPARQKLVHMEGKADFSGTATKENTRINTTATTTFTVEIERR